MSKGTDAAARMVAKGGSIFFVGLLFSYFTSYAYRIIIARWLGPADYGVISLGFAITGVLGGVVGLGLSSGVYRYVSYYHAADKPSRVKGTFFAALKISLPLSILVSVLLFIFAELVSLKIFHSAQLIPVLRLFSIIIPLIFLMTSCLQIARAHMKVQYEVYARNFIENTLKIVATIFLLFFGFGLMGAAFAYVLAILAATIATVYFMQSKVQKLFFSKEQANYNYKELIKYSLPLLFVSFIAPLMSWIDIFFIGYFLNSPSVGFYNVALPTAELAKIAFPALTVLTIPVLTGMFAKKQISDLKVTYKIITRWIFISTLPLSVFMVLFSKQIIRLMFGEQYLVASTSLIILTIGYFLYAITGPAKHMLGVLAKTHYMVINYVIVLGINVVGNLMLIPRIGITGAAISTAVSFSLVNILSLIETNRHIRLRPYSVKWIKPLCAAIISFLVFYVVIKYVAFSSTITLIAGGLGILLLYFVLLLAFRSFEREDLVILRAIRAKLKIKQQGKIEV